MASVAIDMYLPFPIGGGVCKAVLTTTRPQANADHLQYKADTRTGKENTPYTEVAPWVLPEATGGMTRTQSALGWARIASQIERTSETRTVASVRQEFEIRAVCRTKEMWRGLCDWFPMGFNRCSCNGGWERIVQVRTKSRFKSAPQLCGTRRASPEGIQIRHHRQDQKEKLR